MKSYTDLEQSKKLAEILPIESADMYYSATIDATTFKPVYGTPPRVKQECSATYKTDIPCWSLAALLDVLPNEISTGERFIDKFQIVVRKYDGGDNTTFHQIAYGNNRGLSGSWHDMINTGERKNLVDACVEMIVKLHEMNLL